MAYKLTVAHLSGLVRTLDTLAEARSAAAQLLGIELDRMVEVAVPGDTAMYCYSSPAAAEADPDGAYAVAYREIR